MEYEYDPQEEIPSWYFRCGFDDNGELWITNKCAIELADLYGYPDISDELKLLEMDVREGLHPNVQEEGCIDS